MGADRFGLGEATVSDAGLRVELEADSLAESASTEFAFSDESEVMLAESLSAFNVAFVAKVSFGSTFELGFFSNPIHAQFSGLPASFML